MQTDEKYPLALSQGTILAGQYVIEKVLGQGGFGITYRAFDHKTGQQVAVKEFFPDTMAARTDRTTVSAFAGERGESFAYGKACFLEEAETLAQFIGNEQIVRVFSYFEENGTAYFVMEFVEGTSFDQYIKDHGGKVPYEEAEKILLPVIDALAVVHAKGIVHRDVTPDNIYITKDGGVKLLDFGAARYSLGDKSRSLDVVLKHGFAPKEQYTRHGRQGPYTDVYTVGASFYFAVTGRRPPDSIDRLEEDELVPPSSLVKIPQGKEDAILKAMSVQPSGRYQTMGEFRQALMGAPAAGAQSAGGMRQSGMQPMPGGAQQGISQPVQQRIFTAPQPESVQQKSEASKKKKWLLPAGIGAVVVAAAVIIVLVIPHGDFKKGSAHYGSEQNAAASSDSTVEQPPDSGAVLPEGGGSFTGQSDPAEVTEIEINGQKYATDLTFLDLSGQGLNDDDIKDLIYMQKLEVIWLPNNNLTDLSILGNIPTLVEIDATNNRISDISFMGNLNNLKIIVMNQNPISDISVLRNFSTLEKLWFDDTNITDISPIANNKGLTELGFSNSPICDISAIQGMSKLEMLCLPNCGITDISALSECTSLKMLSIFDNDIRDYSPIDQLHIVELYI